MADARLHISFVCTGNICRSPMAEHILDDVIHREGLADRVRVTSAGTGSWHAGDDADPRTVDELAAHGYSTAHTAKQVDDDVLGADLVIPLDHGHERALARMGVPAEHRALLRSFDPEADGDEVEDPYYGGPSGFSRTREQIEAAVPGLLAWIRERLDEPTDPGAP